MKLIECIIPFILAIVIICCASAGENMGVAVMASSLALYAARACMRNTGGR